jgi:predicted ATPase
VETVADKNIATMIQRLYVRNFKNLQHFQVKHFSRVNLITGKNNTGKSSLLEALTIYASGGNFAVLEQILNERGEYLRFSSTENVAEKNVKAYLSLFTRQFGDVASDQTIIIGDINADPDGGTYLSEKVVTLRIVRYIERAEETPLEYGRKRIVLEENIDETSLSAVRVGFEIKNSEIRTIIGMNDGRPSIHTKKGFSTDSIQCIKPKNIDRDINGKLWDKITLTEREEDVISALKIIEPRTTRIAFIEEDSSIGERTRIPVVKLANGPSNIPLKSMGDGINRILTIILALVNAENGYLLIDEFENGLHHSVQKQLWEIIFKLAHKLNVQVFATTHSDDCIRGFEASMREIGVPEQGKLIRLELLGDKIVEVEFDAHELKIATEQEIEIR